MAGRWKNDLTWSDVTPKEVFLNRRAILGAGAALAGASLLPKASMAQEELVPNSFEDITSYNNFYEFGWDKSDPKKYAGELIKMSHNRTMMLEFDHSQSPLERDKIITEIKNTMYA